MKIMEVFADSGEIIEREPTNEELEQRKLDQAESVARKVAVELKAKRKADLLDRLGITEEEAKLLFS